MALIDKLEAIGEGFRTSRNTTDKYTLDQMAVLAAEPLGIEKAAEKDVNFYDYDGTLLYSYTIAEAQDLTELPPAPKPPKDYLSFREWNWTLAQIKEVNNKVDVGAVYRPTDGSTRAVLNISSMTLASVKLYFKLWDYTSNSHVCEINWGDGTVDKITPMSSGVVVCTPQHNYQSVGKYTVTIKAPKTIDIGHASATTPFIGNGKNSTVLIEFFSGDKARIMDYAFYRSVCLKSLTLSSEHNALGSYSLQYAHSLPCMICPSWIKTINSTALAYTSNMRVLSLPYDLTTLGYYYSNNSRIMRLVIPPKISQPVAYGAKTLTEVCVLGSYTSIRSEAFTDCEILGTLKLPDSVTLIDGYSFRRCYSMYEIVIPKNVTSIGAQAFYDATSMKKIVFKPTTPPSVANANAFTNIPTDCVVEVPSASLATYKAATNYSGIAAQMVGV